MHDPNVDIMQVQSDDPFETYVQPEEMQQEPDYDMGYGYNDEYVEPEELPPMHDQQEDLGFTKEEQEILKRAEAKIAAQDPIMAAFGEWDKAPSAEQIELFREQAGDIYFIELGEDSKYIFRPVRRQEWRTLLKQIEKLEELKQTEAIVARCVLYPKLQGVQMGSLKAGDVETLHQMILRASNFMTPEYAVQLVRKL